LVLKLEPQPACERSKCLVRQRLKDSSYPAPSGRSSQNNFELFYPELAPY
jgi:hypothetical protein